MKKSMTTLPFKGTTEQKIALDRLIADYKGQAGALMPVLQKAQDIYGYLPEEVQIMIAEGLNVPLEEVYGISTFYSLYNLNPKGEYKINVCLGTACYVKGAQQILDKLELRLGCKNGSISADGKYSIDATRCVGACGLAPVVIINDDVYGRLTPDMVDDILAKYV